MSKDYAEKVMLRKLIDDEKHEEASIENLVLDQTNDDLEEI